MYLSLSFALLVDRHNTRLVILVFAFKCKVWSIYKTKWYYPVKNVAKSFPQKRFCILINFTLSETVQIYLPNWILSPLFYMERKPFLWLGVILSISQIFFTKLQTTSVIEKRKQNGVTFLNYRLATTQIVISILSDCKL